MDSKLLAPVYGRFVFLFIYFFVEGHTIRGEYGMPGACSRRTLKPTAYFKFRLGLVLAPREDPNAV